MIEPVILQDWDQAARCWSFDIVAGTLGEAGDRARNGYVHLAADSSSNLAAIYVHDGRLWFQYGERRWDTATVSLRHTRSGTGWNHLTVEAPSAAAFEITYPGPLLNPLNLADPTFDALDEEMDDFFAWLAARLGDDDWRTAVLRDWPRGFRET